MHPIQVKDGQLEIRWHEGQWEAWQKRQRYLSLICGLQSGKTVFGPPWMYREFQEHEPVDGLIATPTFSLAESKVIPEFRDFFEFKMGLGSFRSSGRPIFTFSEVGCRKTWGKVPSQPVRVLFGSAEHPDSLESATVGPIWCDEPGQPQFKYASWVALQGRQGTTDGRALFTTTPYTWGWFKRELYDRAKNGEADYATVNFESRMNPAFPEVEWLRAKNTLPKWLFDLRYRGIFTRPAGAVFGMFDRERHTCARFEIPADWQRYMGLDFGPVNTAACKLAREPGAMRFYMYRGYRDGFDDTTDEDKLDQYAAKHAERLLADEDKVPFAAGGAPHETKWRNRYTRAGLPVILPLNGSEDNQSAAMYRAEVIGGMFALNQLMVFDDEEPTISEIEEYSFELNADQEPIPKILDHNKYHRIDALGSICVCVGEGLDEQPIVIKPAGRIPEEDREKIELTRRILGEEEAAKFLGEVVRPGIRVERRKIRSRF